MSTGTDDQPRAEGCETLRDMNGEEIVHEGKVYCIETSGETPGRIVLRRVDEA